MDESKPGLHARALARACNQRLFAVKCGSRLLFFWFLGFFGFALLSFCHDWSPNGVGLLSNAAIKQARINQFVSRSVNQRYGKIRRAQMIIRQGKM
jgi:hypothetical protein